MQRAGDFLGQVVKRLGKKEAALAWLSAAWPGLVGQSLASHTRPVGYSAGTLEIEADRQPWQKQVQEMSADFCARINQAWGSTLISKVRVTAAPKKNSHVSREADNKYIPFIRRRKA